MKTKETKQPRTLLLTRIGDRKKPWGWLFMVNGKAEFGSANFFTSRRKALSHFSDNVWQRNGFEIKEQKR